MSASKCPRWRKLSAQIKQEINHCEICGSKEKLNCHHIFCWRYFKTLRYEKNNIIVVCKNHHVFGAGGVEHNGILLASYLIKNKSEQWAWLLQHLGSDA